MAQRWEPSFVPRLLADDPPQFGWDRALNFGSGPRRPRGADDRRAEHQRAAAKFQHEFVIEARSQLRRLHKSRTWLADQTGLDYTRIGRIFSGQVPMRLTDLAPIAAALSLTSEWARER